MSKHREAEEIIKWILKCDQEVNLGGRVLQRSDLSKTERLSCEKLMHFARTQKVRTRIFGVEHCVVNAFRRNMPKSLGQFGCYAEPKTSHFCLKLAHGNFACLEDCMGRTAMRTDLYQHSTI